MRFSANTLSDICHLPFQDGIQDHLISLYNQNYQKIPIYPLRPEWRQHVKTLYVQPIMKVIPRREQLLTGQTRESPLKDIKYIFNSGEEAYRNIYLVAECGSGKTTMCEFLVYLWVKQHSKKKDEDYKTGDESFMEYFSFLFYISLRDAHSNSISNIEDMIWSQLELESVVKIEDMKKMILDHTSLVILDGLDEYSLEHPLSTRNVGKHLPWRRHSDRCTILTTSRPWKVEQLASELGDKIEREIHITGLEKDTRNRLAKTVISLLDYIKKGQNNNFDDFINYMEEQKLENYMNTPILLMQMVGLWFEGESFGKSQCEIYSKMIDKQIQFAAEVRKIPVASNEDNQQNMFCCLPCGSRQRLPACFSGQHYCKTNQVLLLKLSKLAYELLFGSQENALVFDHAQMKIMGLSQEEIDRCLHLGLLTQYQVFYKITQRQKSISFIHKSHQEFFAAIHLWQTESEADLKQLLARFTSLNLALQVEKVFTFVSGMNPHISREIAKVVMKHVSGDKRIELYRESSVHYVALNEALVRQIQGVILSGIEESRNNGYLMPPIRLQDLWMRDIHQEFWPSRIYECAQSLEFSHVKSIFIDYVKTPSNTSTKQIWGLVNATSPNLNKVFLNGLKISAIQVTKILTKNRETLQAVGLQYYSVDGLDCSRLDQNALVSILEPGSLALDTVTLTHEQLGIMFTQFRTRAYTELRLSNLHCQSHGNTCELRLDLSASKTLLRLQLYNIPVHDAVLVPHSLEWCNIGKIPDTGSLRILRSLIDAHNLDLLYCSSLRDHALVELVRIMPRLVTLSYITLDNIDITGKEKICLQNMQALKQIELLLVTLTAAQLIQLLASLPSYKVFVTLGRKHELEDWTVTITDCDNNDIIEQVTASPNYVKHSDAVVEHEDDKCVVNWFGFYYTN